MHRSLVAVLVILAVGVAACGIPRQKFERRRLANLRGGMSPAEVQAVMEGAPRFIYSMQVVGRQGPFDEGKYLFFVDWVKDVGPWYSPLLTTPPSADILCEYHSCPWTEFDSRELRNPYGTHNVPAQAVAALLAAAAGLSPPPLKGSYGQWVYIGSGGTPPARRLYSTKEPIEVWLYFGNGWLYLYFVGGKVLPKGYVTHASVEMRGAEVVSLGTAP
jgi:hypothetical protein